MEGGGNSTSEYSTRARVNAFSNFFFNKLCNLVSVSLWLGLGIKLGQGLVANILRYNITARRRKESKKKEEQGTRLLQTGSFLCPQRRPVRRAVTGEEEGSV